MSSKLYKTIFENQIADLKNHTWVFYSNTIIYTFLNLRTVRKNRKNRLHSETALEKINYYPKYQKDPISLTRQDLKPRLKLSKKTDQKLIFHCFPKLSKHNKNPKIRFFLCLI